MIVSKYIDTRRQAIWSSLMMINSKLNSGMGRPYLRKSIFVFFCALFIGSFVFLLHATKASNMLDSYNVSKLWNKHPQDIKVIVASEKKFDDTKIVLKEHHVNLQNTSSISRNNDSIGNWTILLTVNNAYFDFFRNWYSAYQRLNITYSLVIVAEDDFVYKKLQTFKSETVSVTRSEYGSVNVSAKYGSAAFSKLVSARPSHILKYLRTGINVFYTDIDMVWMQNPFPYFKGDFDIWIELDAVSVYCTGLMAIKSTKSCVKLMEDWENSLQKKVEIDQTAFNKVVQNTTARMSVLDSKKFPTGLQYFEKFTRKQRADVVIVHNNWIIGHGAKLIRFKKMNLWFI